MRCPRILVADDHPITLAGILSLVEKNSTVVGHVRDGRTLVQEALRLRPDLIIMDIGMPLLNGIDAGKRILKTWPDAKLLFLTMHASRMYVREALRAGASGYLLKTSAAEELWPAIRKILKGGVYLTPALGPAVVESVRTTSGRRLRATRLTDRQREVLQLLAEGRVNKEVALILGISVKTIEFHRGQIMRKMGFQSFAQLIAFAVRDGLV